MRKLVTLNWKSKLLLGSVSLGLTVVAISSLTTHNTTKTVVRSTTTFNPKTSLEPQTLGSRFLRSFFRQIAKAFTRSNFRNGAWNAVKTFTSGAVEGAGYATGYGGTTVALDYLFKPSYPYYQYQY